MRPWLNRLLRTADEPVDRAGGTQGLSDAIFLTADSVCARTGTLFSPRAPGAPEKQATPTPPPDGLLNVRLAVMEMIMYGFYLQADSWSPRRPRRFVKAVTRAVTAHWGLNDEMRSMMSQLLAVVAARAVADAEQVHACNAKSGVPGATALERTREYVDGDDESRTALAGLLLPHQDECAGLSGSLLQGLGVVTR